MRPIRSGSLEFSFRGKLKRGAGVERSTCEGTRSDSRAFAGYGGDFEDDLVGRWPRRGTSLDNHVEGANSR